MSSQNRTSLFHVILVQMGKDLIGQHSLCGWMQLVVTEARPQSDLNIPYAKGNVRSIGSAKTEALMFPDPNPV
jgi:hypothetical protein